MSKSAKTASSCVLPPFFLFLSRFRTVARGIVELEKLHPLTPGRGSTLTTRVGPARDSERLLQNQRRCCRRGRDDRAESDRVVRISRSVKNGIERRRNFLPRAREHSILCADEVLSLDDAISSTDRTTTRVDARGCRSKSQGGVHELQTRIKEHTRPRSRRSSVVVFCCCTSL